MCQRLFHDSILKSEEECIVGIGTILNDHNANLLREYKKKIVFSSGVGYGTLNEDFDETWGLIQQDSLIQNWGV